MISLCGEGFGHTTRCLSIGEELKGEHDLLYVAYGKSKDFIEKCGYSVVETYPEIKLMGKDGKFDFKRSILNKEYNPSKAILRELKLIKQYNPDLIISDCKYSTVIAAKFLKKPHYIITNQNYTRVEGARKEKYIIYPLMKMLNIINKYSEGVIIPDLPPNNTVCEYNLLKLENLIFTGPLIRYNPQDYNIEDGGYILSVIGGFEYRFRILELLGKISKKRKLKVKMVCGSYSVAEKLKKIVDEKYTEIIPLSTNMGELISKCSFIVCHGGHSTLMESISFGKPMITIPDLGHPEQENNAKKISHLKCGISLSHTTLDRDLENGIDEITTNDIYRKNAEKLSKLCTVHNGRKNIRKIINNFEKRINLKN